MREFSVPMVGSSVTGASTLIFVNPPAAPSVNIEFLRFWAGQFANATSAQQPIELVTQASVFPTLTGITPQKLKPADPNVSVIVSGTAGAAGTSGINASAEGAGTKTVVHSDAFNVLNGWLYIPTPPETRIMPAGFAQGQGVFFPSAPATLTSWTAGLNFREV